MIIVDEPTAGLDPSERNRFYNLLSELGENTIIILSTHIVEDVSTLCSRMAIICEGELLMEGKPQDGIDALKGKIYQKTISKNELQHYKKEYQVISTKLIEGKLNLHVESEVALDEGFMRTMPDLEDVYFSHIARKVDPIAI